MRASLDNAIADRRFILSHVVGFAALALLLAAVGVYAVTSHIVRGRGRELSIRAALGARSAHLVWLAMREGVVVAVVGGLLSVALTPQLRGFLYEVNPWDWSAPVVSCPRVGSCRDLFVVLPGVRATATYRPIGSLS